MIQKHAIKELDEMFHKLPDPIQEFIVSPETSTRLKVIGEHHSLTKEELSQLGIETGYALIGMLTGEEFITDLSESFQISEEQASAIYEDIEESLFKDLDDLIEKIDNPSAQGSTQTASPKPPQNLPTGAGLPSLIDTRLSGMTRMPKEDIAISSRPSPIINQINKMTAPTASPTIPNSIPRPPQPTQPQRPPQQLPQPVRPLDPNSQTPRPAQDTSTRTTPEGIVSPPQKPLYKSEDPYREKI